MPLSSGSASLATTHRPPVHRGGWPAVLAVTVGLFLIVTTEILPIGLLPRIAETFAVSDGAAGLTMTVPGLLAAVAAPTITVATGRFDRRRMLIGLTLALVAANLLAAVAPGHAALLGSRVLVGLTIGGFWSIGAGLADRLVPAYAVPRATAVVFAAVPLGSVLGVPAGTYVGQLAGWRSAFVLLGVLSAGVVVALAVLLPALPPVRVTRASVLSGLLRTRATRVALAVTFLVVLAHFGTYTYVAPFLERVTGVGARDVGTVLLCYGIAGLVGNFAAGWGIPRAPRATGVAVLALLAATTALLPVAGANRFGAIGLLVLWGLAYGAVPVCSQTWFVRAAPGAPEAATVLFTASFQATISIGAFAGGVVLDATTPPVLMLAGGATALLALALSLGARQGRG